MLQYFKDDATAFNAQKRGTIVEKGVVNNKVSERVFRLLEQYTASRPISSNVSAIARCHQESHDRTR